MKLPAPLIALQPATSAAFQRALNTVLPLTEAHLLALCTEQLRSAQRRTVCRPPADCSDYERAALALADQFAVAVDGISEAQVQALIDEAGAATVNALLNALYLTDVALRLELVAPAVLAAADQTQAAAPPEPAAPAAAGADSESIIAAAIADFAATAVLADEVDAITSELVRLRCAQTHHCRLCGSLRQRSALDAGFEETMAERVARYETAGFDAAQVAALHLCDALIMQPADADEALRTELEQFFSPAQIAEICFDVVKWSQQKALVAAHSDAPPWEGIHVLDFDPQGHPVFSGPD